MSQRALTGPPLVVNLVALALAAVASLGGVACSGKSGASLCVGTAAPVGCDTPCDPSSALSQCSAGFHCSPDGRCDIQCTQSGNECGSNASCTEDGRCTAGDGDGGCTGIACNVADCGSMNMPLTTLTGTVYAPNGTLPLYGINVYVPNSDPGPFMPGVQCGQCANGLPGDAVAAATTDEMGNFTLSGVPSGANIPVVITTGKWRREITVSNVASCTSQAIVKADTTLPASHTDMTPNTTSVDLPKIAISTGQADSLECLVRRLGFADSEITTDAQGGSIHLFADKGAGGGVGTASFDTTFGGGKGAFNDSTTLWGTATDPGKLNNYDIVILSCEGDQHAETKPQEAMNHLKAYADLGGRVFLSHWHNIWIEGATHPTGPAKPMVWSALATYSDDNSKGPTTTSPDTIDEVNNPKGMSFATWMLNVKGSTTRDAIPIENGTGKDSCSSVDKTNVEQWVYWQADAKTQLTQNFQFTTPNEMPIANRCGKVVFSDMHVSGGPVTNPDKSIASYPTSCGTETDLLDQEKALAFMFFDISSCVGTLF